MPYARMWRDSERVVGNLDIGNEEWGLRNVMLNEHGERCLSRRAQIIAELAMSPDVGISPGARRPELQLLPARASQGRLRVPGQRRHPNRRHNVRFPSLSLQD